MLPLILIHLWVDCAAPVLRHAQASVHGGSEVAALINYKVPMEKASTLSLVVKVVCIPLQLALFYYVKSRVMPPPGPPKKFSPSAKRAMGTPQKDVKSE